MDDSAGTFNVFADNVPILTQGTFGGDGSNSSFSLSTGTTTLNVASAEVYIRNYTTFSLTGDGVLDISNAANTGTLLILKTTGNATHTSSGSIDLATDGGIGGAGAASNGTGTAGSDSPLYFDSSSHFGSGGGPQPAGSGGAAGAAPDNTTLYTTSSDIL